MKNSYILKSFAKATFIGTLTKNDDDETTSSGSTGGGYSAPTQENGILAPYNYSFA